MDTLALQAFFFAYGALSGTLGALLLASFWLTRDASRATMLLLGGWVAALCSIVGWLAWSRTVELHTPATVGTALTITLFLSVCALALLEPVEPRRRRHGTPLTSHRTPRT